MGTLQPWLRKSMELLLSAVMVFVTCRQTHAGSALLLFEGSVAAVLPSPPWLSLF